MRAVRRGLPGEEQERDQASRHQHGAAATAAREVQPVLGLLPADARVFAREAIARTGQGPAAAAAAVRVLGRLRRLRRNSVHFADDPAVRRPGDHRATRPAARPSMAATCRPRPTARMRKGAGRPGPTRCSKTMPSLAWAYGWPSTSRHDYAQGTGAAPGLGHRRPSSRSRS